MATGEYIGLFDHDDLLHPCALYEYVKAINEKMRIMSTVMKPPSKTAISIK